jgi:CheY-like chemotaxis protein
MMAILIVDDDPVQCRLLEGMLQKFGYETLTRDNGDAALALLMRRTAIASSSIW